MSYFGCLDAGEFEDALEQVLSKGRTFKPIMSLPDWERRGWLLHHGVRPLQTVLRRNHGNIRQRIKQHWSARKPFDRILFGTPYDSVFPVDELRPLDTTRLYAARSETRSVWRNASKRQRTDGSASTGWPVENRRH